MNQLLAFTRSEAVEKVTTLMLVNILWMIFSAFIITLPLATAGLFAVMMPLARGESIDPLRTFFSSMRRYALKSMAIGVINILIAGLVFLNFSAFSHMEMTRLPALFSLNVTVLVGLLTALVNFYLWPLLVTVELPLFRLVKASVKLVMLHLGWSLVMTLLAFVPLLVSLVLPGFFILLGIYAAAALTVSWGAWQVLEKYTLETL